MSRVACAPPARTAVQDGVAVIMPAYREAENLASTVEDFLVTLDTAGHDHRIVIVDDGSPDATGELMDELAARYPGRIIGVRHAVNRGYGAAVRTGIAAALERTNLRWLLLTDSDGQYKAADLLALLRIQREQRADGVIGYRVHRADSPARRLNGHLWTVVSRLLLGTRSRDVDCAYKLLDRRLLDDLRLMGEAAAIDPELLAKIQRRRARIVEHPVDHHPREHGRPTGASPWVIARSLVSILGVYRNLIAEGHRWRAARWLLRPRDPVLALVTLAAVLLSAGAFAHHLRHGTVLAYADSVSHLLITRRVVDGPTAGAAQLGGVWLPLSHLLSLPLAWNDVLFYSGFAGAAVSMLAYVVTVWYVYLIAARMAAGRAGGTGDRVAGAAAAGLFALNANVLYLQSTPMTELLLFACVAAAVHHLQAWCRTGRYEQLAMVSCATVLATLTRYEGWVLAAAVAAVVAYVSVRRWKNYARVEAHLVFFGVAAFSGVAGWVGWNYVIFGDPLYWYSGEYADPSLWALSGDRNIGAAGVATRTYAFAMVHDLGWITLAVAAVGLLVHGWRERARPVSVAPYILLVFVPFFVYALYSGQRPLHVPEIHGGSYNIRFALVMLLAASVFAGYLVSLAPRGTRPRTCLRTAVAAGVVATVLAVPGTATVAEPLNWNAERQGRAVRDGAAWLRRHYDGGTVLMENYGNEPVVFNARIPIGRIVYEGSFGLWRRALTDPAGSGIRWIYARTVPELPDETWRTLRGTPALTRHYTLVYRDDVQRVYRRTDPR
ncbi:glycosyltransferase involved in cell wall biosynthesis [Actinomadura pelletieri DSM 43383]|uniref:Glycosyltransferase involved in cell wall biosynthesis n=1 Tax=Actinomadura pelletieri DSM 43383 TaxID=1120940 RepID=A0A495QAV1_9ACTN|nr:glycosyltransferase family 2 protein [Actinomadura pelletieri]RKS68803.1 glycosyltransferase involved in cell wall biosynthesis [Actinomadura pelletieri DSM 43383]